MSHWSLAASFPVLFLGFLIWLAAGVVWIIHLRRSPGKRANRWLETLRFVLITLLVLTLLRPEFIRSIQKTDEPAVVVLTDVSGSMRTKDLLISNAVARRIDWVEEQHAVNKWEPLTRNARVVRENFPRRPEETNASPGAVQDPGTDLSLALDSVLQHTENLKAVLLLSDGDWNTGKSPIGVATRYRDRGVPIFSVAVGRESPLPDLALENVTTPSYGLFGEQISIPFSIKSHLPREVKTTVVLRDDKGEEIKKEVVIPPLGAVHDAVAWYPRAVGDAQLSLSFPPEPEEYLPENNRHDFRIDVRVETLKILLVDSLPRWEYRYLRNALARDPGVEMHCILFHPGMSPGSGRHYLTAFPGTKEALSRYDVIFLGDVGIGEGELSEEDAELIRGLVEQQGSGLVLLPGRRGRQLTLLQTALKDLFPVTLDEEKPEGIGLQNESNLLLSSTGKGHLLTRFHSDEEWNAELWRRLPGFYWSAGVAKSRPGSEVLAVHSALRNSWGRMPLLVTRSFGSGKVLFMGTDSAWRWRRGVEDKFHYRFWSQVARWMAHQRHLAEKEGIRLSYMPETPLVGDTLFLQATVLDASGFPLEEGPVTGKAVLPSGKTAPLEFLALEGGWGVFKTSLPLEEGGVYKVQVGASEHDRNLETEITVKQPILEKEGQPVNAKLLAEISSISRGEKGTVDSLDQLIERISLLPEPKPLEIRVRLWSHPYWGGFILLLLGIYWTGRKLAGMV